MSTTVRKLRVFLCHASPDKPIVREIYQRLLGEGWIDPWLDEEKLLPGQDWGLEIEKAVERADVVIVCLSSNSVTKEGYVQRELKYVLDIALEKPEGIMFIIPLRLDDCSLPRRLRAWQFLDYFPDHRQERSYSRLIQSLKFKNEEVYVHLDNQINDVKRHTPKVEKKVHQGHVVTSTVSSRGDLIITPKVVLVALITGSLVGSGVVITTGIQKIIYINVFPLLLLFASAFEILSIRNTVPLITYRTQISFIVGSLTSLPVSIFFIVFLGQFNSGIEFSITTMQLDSDRILLVLIKFSLMIIIFWFLSVLGALLAADLHTFMIKPK